MNIEELENEIRNVKRRSFFIGGFTAVLGSALKVPKLVVPELVKPQVATISFKPPTSLANYDVSHYQSGNPFVIKGLIPGSYTFNVFATNMGP